MPRTWQKRTLLIGAVTLLALGLGILFVHHEHKVHLERMLGAWEGTMRFHVGPLMRKQRLVLRVFKEDDSYRAVFDQIDLGRKNIPPTKFSVGSSSVVFESGTAFVYDGKLNGEATEIAGRWRWPGAKYSQPLTLARTATPDAVREPLAAADYAARAGSDLQGFWQGTLKVDTTSLRLHLKIAEAPDGSFRAEMNSIDQPPIVPLPATTVDFRKPHVKISFQGVGALFEGSINGSDTTIDGKWTQGLTSPLTFNRADPQAEMATAEAEKNYSRTNDAELQGHWRGLLAGKLGVSLHLVFNIAQLPDGSFSGTLDSPDQSLLAMPLTVTAFHSQTVRLEIKSANCVFLGKLADGRLSGTWRFNAGKASSLTMEREKST